MALRGLTQIIILCLLSVLLLWQPTWLHNFSHRVFDSYQTLWPREVLSSPVTIVTVDEASIAQTRFQWPWPRYLLRQLIDKIFAYEPAVLGVDVFFSEPDPYDPQKIVTLLPNLPKQAKQAILAQPNQDFALGRLLQNRQTVLGFVGLNGQPTLTTNHSSFFYDLNRPGLIKGLKRFDGALQNLPEISHAINSQGFLNVSPEQGIIRRLPLVANIGGILAPNFDLEIIRRATGAPTIALEGGHFGLNNIKVGKIDLPVDQHGNFWIHFSPSYSDRYVSAVDVLHDRVAPDKLYRKLVILSVTGLGITDFPTTSLGLPMSGAEIHAQVLENIYSGYMLTQPGLNYFVEAVLFLLLSMLWLYGIKSLRIEWLSLVIVSSAVLTWGLSVCAYLYWAWLIDGVLPILASTCVLLSQLWRQRLLSDAASPPYDVSTNTRTTANQ